MSNEVTNPIRGKMLHYAERMEDLIQEAYADGIVLMTVPPEKGIETLPLLEGQGVYRVVKYLPLREHMHLNLDLPMAVKASAATVIGPGNQPADIIPSFKIPMPKQNGK